MSRARTSLSSFDTLRLSSNGSLVWLMSLYVKVDVLLAVATPTALAAKNATRTIPIVFLGVSDPVAAGLLDSLARPIPKAIEMALKIVDEEERG
jgi:hypothetical protein